MVYVPRGMAMNSIIDCGGSAFNRRFSDEPDYDDEEDEEDEEELDEEEREEENDYC